MDARSRRAVRWGAGAALWVAGLAAIAPLVGTFPLAPIVELVVRAAPGGVATAAIELFGSAAQPLLALGIVAAVLGGAAAVGAIAPERRPDGMVVLPLSALALVTAGLVAWSTGGVTSWTLLAAGLALVPLGVVLFAARWRSSRRGVDSARRGAVKRVAGGVAAAAGIGAIGRLAGPVGSTEDGLEGGEPLPGRAKRTAGRTVVRTSRSGGDGAFGFDAGAMPDRVESIGDHYVVDIAYSNPRIDAGRWRLDVTGAVDEPYALSHEDLLGHDAATSRIVTMVCISNPVGGNLISTTRWHGVPLRALLDRAGVREGAVDVVTHADDGYSEALPVDVVRERDDVMLAFGADGRTLPRANGFPARLLIPGRYGMKSTKWVTGIELADAEHDAYWEARGWDEEAVINTLSYVRTAVQQGNRAMVGGVAYAGTRGIDRVEVSVDDGDTWHDADLEAAPSPFAWRRWRYEFPAPDRGEVDTVVRAIDGTGERQTPEVSPPHPAGSTGWHRPTMELRRSGR